MPAYSVRNVKSFNGRNGLGFSCDLYNGGRKVAAVRDEARGGCFAFDWLAKHVDDQAADEAALLAHCATLPKWHPTDPLEGQDPAEGYAVDPDTFLAGLVDEYENTAKLRKLLRHNVIYRTAEGKLQQLRGETASAVLVEAIGRKYPGAVVLNKLPEDEALAILRGVQS